MALSSTLPHLSLVAAHCTDHFLFLSRLKIKKESMGGIISIIQSRSAVIRSSTLESPPIVYTRSSDFTASGNPKPGLKESWELAMRSMIAVDLQTRKLLMPVIEERMAKMNYKAQYKQDKISSVLAKFSNWNEPQIFELHDLFQIFETEGDGLINVTEMIMGLEHFNDKTPLKLRVDTICRFDDGNGHMKFENFLRMIRILDSDEHDDNPLRHTFEKIRIAIRFLRHMSVPQQILSGFL